MLHIFISSIFHSLFIIENMHLPEKTYYRDKQDYMYITSKKFEKLRPKSEANKSKVTVF